MRTKYSTPSWLIALVALLTILLWAASLAYDQIVFKSAHFASTLAVMKDKSEGPLQGGNGGSFKHYNTVPPKETKVFPLFDNRGKTAIVTGAGAGIGLAVAQGFAESGANVAIWYHGNRKAIDRAKEIEEEYGVKCEQQHLGMRNLY